MADPVVDQDPTSVEELAAQEFAALSVRSVEEMAEVSKAHRAVLARAERARRDARPVPCPLCRGNGMDLHHRLAALWGNNCWGCAGWGGVLALQAAVRSPFGRHPNRLNKQEVRRP